MGGNPRLPINICGFSPTLRQAQFEHTMNSLQKTTMQQEIINKSIVRDFYQRAIGQGDLAFASQIIADNYVQHSPAVKPGKAGLLEALAYMKQMPKPATTASPFMRLIAEGDYVVTNLRFIWGDKQKAVIDIFRLAGGQLAEHWDAIQDQPETTLNGHILMDGPMPVDGNYSAETNKTIVRDLYQRVFMSQQLEALSDFVAYDLSQHKPKIANGLTGLNEYLKQELEHFAVEKIQLVIGEGDFVFVQSAGKLEQKPTMFYDVFRLSSGKVVEQWGLDQIAT